MRSSIAIICLITFVALQYGKVISYWQCRLMTTVVHCDCEKKLTDHHTDKEHATPLSIAKEKADEVYLLHEWITPPPSFAAITTYTGNHYRSLIPADHSFAVFQPPRA